MEALNTAGLTPISVFSGSNREPRRSLPLPTIPAIKSSSPNPLVTTFQGSLAFASSFIAGAGLAKALTYEEALQQSMSSPAPEAGFDFDVSGLSGFIDSVVGFVTENPTVVAGGAVVLALPLVLSQVLGGSKPWGVDSATNAYAKLADDSAVGLVDIRAPAEIRKVGSPDIRGLGKNPASIPYKGDDKPGFLKKLSAKFKDPGSTTLFILDKFDGNSELVAELATANGFKAAFAIRDGVEGRRGWMNSNLPWIPPKKTFGLDFGIITDAIGDGADRSAIAIAIAAAAGLGVLAFSEVETILEVLGSAAIIQILSKKLLFAEDRKKTLQQVNEFLNTKVAPQELVDDIKEIGKALLPTSGSSMALPAPAETTSAEGTVQTVETVTELKVEVAEPAPVEVNSVPKQEIKAESLPVTPTPLSPFPYYPDLKPPSSPSPSQP
ncbi:hypothetical protein MLD38_036342 [Melastoma candidum]|uniref:Uncharacterized protein n=1 Tax=Melastoma candidum TaxID=119954 RepID=A0ACB9LJA2_9MYRT|nr:hypothetical protein MLD38_036342 [Melastoma candidum]